MIGIRDFADGERGFVASQAKIPRGEFGFPPQATRAGSSRLRIITSMQQTTAFIESLRRSGANRQQLTLSVAPGLARLQPGQSILTPAQPNSWEPYLLERWWPIHCAGGLLVVERPLQSDSNARRFEPGQSLSLLGPVGQALPFRKKLRQVLLIAEDCAPDPLRLAVDHLLARQANVTLILLGTARDADASALDPRVEIIHGAPSADNPRHWPGQVLSVGWADQVFITTAAAGQRARFAAWRKDFGELRNGIPPNTLWGMLTPRWACGAGACGACAIATHEGTKLTCRQGPALDLMRCRLDENS